VGVSSIIERRVAEVTCPCNLARFEQALAEKPAWLVIRDENHQALGVIRQAPARAAFDQAFNQALFDAEAHAEQARRAEEATAPEAEAEAPAGAEAESGPETQTAEAEGAEQAAREREALAQRVREETRIDPRDISGFYRAADVEVGYTLTQAQRIMRENDVEVLVARRMLGSPQARALGVMTAAMLEQAIVER